MQKWREDPSIDEYVGDDTSVNNVFVAKPNNLIIKLSNAVLSVVFANESEGNYNFNRCVTLRHSRMNKKQVSYGDLELSIFYQYESFF